MIRKIIAGTVALLALVVASVTGVVVAGYWRTMARHDLSIMLPPVVIPLVLAATAIWFTVFPAQTRRSTGGMIGFSLGSILYLIFPGLQLLLQYDMVRQDGTGFWAVIMLPSIYLGMPLPLIGAVLGLTIGWIVDWKQRRRIVQQATAPYSEPATRSPQG
jgi:hypothetical protein